MEREASREDDPNDRTVSKQKWGTATTAVYVDVEHQRVWLWDLREGENARHHADLQEGHELKGFTLWSVQRHGQALRKTDECHGRSNTQPSRISQLQRLERKNARRSAVDTYLADTDVGRVGADMVTLRLTGHGRRMSLATRTREAGCGSRFDASHVEGGFGDEGLRWPPLPEYERSCFRPHPEGAILS